MADKPNPPQGNAARSGLSGNAWNLLLSALNPEITKAAKTLGKKLPELFHTDVGNRLLGVLGGWIEGKAHTQTGLASAVIEKFSDFVENVSGEATEARREPVPAAHHWMDRFLQQARERPAKVADAKQSDLRKAVTETEKRFRAAEREHRKMQDDLQLAERNLAADPKNARLQKTKEEAERRFNAAERSLTETKDELDHAKKELAAFDHNATVQEELKKLGVEFEATKKVVEMVETAAKDEADKKKAAQPAAVKVDWDKEWEKVKDAAKTALTFVDQQAGKAVPAVQGFRNWLAERGVRR